MVVTLRLNLQIALALVAVAVAEPEADPQVYTTGLYNPYTYSSVYSPYTYGSYIKPAVYGGYGYRLLKREAESEPEADPALIYGNGLYNPYAYSAGIYSPYTYGSYIRPSVYGGYRLLKREAESEPEADPALIYSNGLINPYTYSAGIYSPYTYGSYIRPSVYGGYRLLKREAEAEPKADPALLYGNGLYSPYAYSSVYRPYTYGSYIRPAVYGGYYY